MQARLQYIHSVTDVSVTEWFTTQTSSALPSSVFLLYNQRWLNGTFITAHIGEVQRLCSLREIAMGDFVIANTCIWEKTSNKKNFVLHDADK